MLKKIIFISIFIFSFSYLLFFNIKKVSAAVPCSPVYGPVKCTLNAAGDFCTESCTGKDFGWTSWTAGECPPEDEQLGICADAHAACSCNNGGLWCRKYIIENTPTPPPQQPTCKVTGPPSICTNTAYPVSATCTNCNRLEIYASKTSVQSWTKIAGCNGTSCSGTYPFSTAEPYYVVCDAYNDNYATKCSGNPWCSFNTSPAQPPVSCAGWSDCTAEDRITVTVNSCDIPTATFSSVCTQSTSCNTWNGDNLCYSLKVSNISSGTFDQSTFFLSFTMGAAGSPTDKIRRYLGKSTWEPHYPVQGEWFGYYLYRCSAGQNCMQNQAVNFIWSNVTKFGSSDGQAGAPVTINQFASWLSQDLPNYLVPVAANLTVNNVQNNWIGGANLKVLPNACITGPSITPTRTPTPPTQEPTMVCKSKTASDPNGGGIPSGSEVKPGQIFNYSVNIQNTSTTTAYDVMINDTLPSIVTYNGVFGLPCEVTGTDASGRQLLECRIGNVSAGSSKSIIFQVKVKNTVSAGPYTNSAKIIYFTSGGKQKETNLCTHDLKISTLTTITPTKTPTRTPTRTPTPPTRTPTKTVTSCVNYAVNESSNTNESTIVKVAWGSPPVITDLRKYSCNSSGGLCDIETMDNPVNSNEVYLIANKHANGSNPTVYRLNKSDGSLTRVVVLNSSTKFHGFAFRPGDSGILWAGSESGGIFTINLSTGAVTKKISTGGISTIAWNTTGSRLYAAATTNLYEYIYSGGNLALNTNYTARLPGDTDSMDMTSDGKIVGYNDSGNYFYFYDVYARAVIDPSHPYKPSRGINGDGFVWLCGQSPYAFVGASASDPTPAPISCSNSTCFSLCGGNSCDAYEEGFAGGQCSGKICICNACSTTSSSGPTPTRTRTPTPGGKTPTRTRTPTPGGKTPTKTRTPTPGGVSFTQILTNASFETDGNADKLPDGWSRNRSSDVRVSYTGANGSYVFRIGPSGSDTSYYYIGQYKAYTGTSGNIWKFRVWSKVENPGAAGRIRVTLRFKKSDGTYAAVRTYLTENTTGGYQTASVSAPVNYVGVEIRLESSNTSGYIYFDDVRLGR